MKLLSSLLLAGAFACQVSAADVSLRIQPEREWVHRGGSREVIVQVEIEAKKPENSKRTPMNLSVVLDRSGSMQGAKIEKARQAAMVALDKLDDDDFFSLVIYDTDTEVLIAPERVGNRDRRDSLKRRIERIQPGGSTALHAGVTLGAKQVRKFIEKERVNRVILLSDGIANVGPSRTSDLTSLGRELREERISVSTVGLGDDYNEDLMTALAESSNANYYYVQDAEKLPGIFAEELNAVQSVVARTLNIRITVPEGVKLQEIVGQPEIKCQDRAVEISMPEFFGGEKRKYLAKCIVDAKVPEALDVAAVEMKYEAADGAKATIPSQAANVKFTEDQKKSDDSLISEVAKEKTLVENRLAQELAVKYADEGRAKDASNVLRQQTEFNSTLPAAAAPANLSEINKKLNQTAQELETRGNLEKSSRKAIQYENWKGKNSKQ